MLVQVVQVVQAFLQVGKLNYKVFNMTRTPVHIYRTDEKTLPTLTAWTKR